VSGTGWIVAITGRPATGKSALAARLRARFGWPVLAKDVAKEALLDSLGTGDRAWSRRLSDASFELLFRFAPFVPDAARACVLEGNFRGTADYARLGALARSMGARLLVVELRASDAAIVRRLCVRSADPSRHPGHRDGELVAEVGPEAPARTVVDPGAGTGTAAATVPHAQLAFETDVLDDALLVRMVAAIEKTTAGA
jgi:glucokinase